MNMTQEVQTMLLEEHYSQCLAFWKREKHSELSAKAMALLDILHTKHNPFKPKGELLDVEIRRTVMAKLLQEFCDSVRKELGTSIQTQFKQTL